MTEVAFRGGDIIHRGGQYSPVNNVRGDIIHGGTLFTPTPILKAIGAAEVSGLARETIL